VLRGGSVSGGTVVVGRAAHGSFAPEVSADAPIAPTSVSIVAPLANAVTALARSAGCGARRLARARLGLGRVAIPSVSARPVVGVQSLSPNIHGRCSDCWYVDEVTSASCAPPPSVACAGGQRCARQLGRQEGGPSG
jgi:hypothetical protein